MANHGITARCSRGCKLAEEVIFFELPHLHRSAPELQIPSSPTAVRATVRSATVADIGALALLDAACFNVLWHMGPADLRQLVLFGNLTLAEMEGSLAGYLAMTTRQHRTGSAAGRTSGLDRPWYRPRIVDWRPARCSRSGLPECGAQHAGRQPAGPNPLSLTWLPSHRRTI